MDESGRTAAAGLTGGWPARRLADTDRDGQHWRRRTCCAVSMCNACMMCNV